MISTDSSATNTNTTNLTDTTQESAILKKEENKNTNKIDTDSATSTTTQKSKKIQTKTTQSATASNNSTKKATNPYSQTETYSHHQSHHSHHMPHHHHQQQHPYMNYYPYMPRGSTGSVQPAYPSAHLDQNGAAWPQAMAAAAMAAAMVDPATLAAYMNGATNGPNGYLPANPADLAQYDQFSFGFTPAFGFGYNSSGSLDYHANTNTAAWTNSPSAIANSSNSSSTSSSATNTTATSPPINDTNKSTTSTTNQTTNVPAKWVQMVQDPLSVQHMNELNTAYVAQQQLSPVDLYQHVTSVNNRHNYQQHNQRHMLNYHTNHYNNTTTNGLFPPYYHGNQSNQMIHSGTNHHHYSSNKHHNYNYQLNKIENGINSININTNPSDKEPKQVAQLTTPIDNQQTDDSEQNLDLTKSDSKTWASIVSVNQQQSSRSSPSPTYNQQFEQNDKKIKQINKPTVNQPQQEQQTNFDLFAFPPISVNSLNTKAEKIEPKTKVATATTAIASTTKKQQLYNSYQKQQQFNMSTTTVQNNKVKTNGESTTEPLKLNGSTTSSHYYKKHQPSQHTISSFMTNLDKSLFFNDKTDEQTTATTTSEQNVLDLTELKVYTNPNAYNPKELNTSPKAARFFVIKSYSEDDVHRSIKYNIWCSTEHGNRRLDSAYFKGDSQVPVYLFFSVNGSGHFCGMAEMMSRVDYNKKTDVWSQDKWRGCFQVKWIYVKDVPNSLLRNIKLENNDNKPVTNSRDTQEIPFEKGKQVLKVFHTYNHSSSILDDFDHYERKQEEDTFKSLNHNVNFNQIYNQIEYINNHQFMMDQQFVTMENNLIITNNNSNKLVDTNVSNTNTELNANNESTSLVNSSSSSSTMTTSTTTATNTTVSSSATSSPMSASSSSSSASSVSSSDESKEIEINKKEQQQHQPQLVVT